MQGGISVLADDTKQMEIEFKKDPSDIDEAVNHLVYFK